MDERVEKKIYSLEEAVSRVVDESKTLAGLIDDDADLVEDLQQIAMALLYETETLKVKLTIGTPMGKT